MRRTAVTLVFVLLAGVSSAATQAESQNPLARIKALSCAFPVYAAGSWKGGTISADVKQSSDLTVIVTEIDADGGTALVGPAHATALLTPNSLHLMERTMLGSLSMITVLSPLSDRRTVRAVRSRHDYVQMAIPGFVAEPTITQHYGECEVTS